MLSSEVETGSKRGQLSFSIGLVGCLVCYFCIAWLSVMYLSLRCVFCLLAHISIPSSHLLSQMVGVTWEQKGYMSKVGFYLFCCSFAFASVVICCRMSSGNLWCFFFVRLYLL